jgi:uracil-DNA glycosylase family 4
MTMDRDALRRQLEGHLQSLKAAGIDWLPQGPPLDAAALFTSAGATAAAAPSQDRSPSSPAAEPAQRHHLQLLADTVAACTRCKQLASTRTQTVFSDGPPGAELCFIGEAPGADEDAQGKPFVGAAGQLLNKIIAAMGLQREEVYICNIIKCRPPGNRTPLPDEASNCREYLEKQLELARPKYIVALGSTAASNLLQTTKPLGQLRGKFHDFKGSSVVVTYHPAYLLPHRAPDKKKDVWDDMKMLLTRMGRPIPQKADKA